MNLKEKEWHDLPRGSTAVRQTHLLLRIRLILVLFAATLVASGLTAIPLQWETDLLARWLGAADDAVVTQPHNLVEWIVLVRNALRETYAKYPFIAYGTDWLAFAHIMIAIAFWGPIRDPVRNIWVIRFGMIACALVVPLALIAGQIRGIPFGWRLIDCSFGIFGLLPLGYALYLTRKLEAAKKQCPQPTTSAARLASPGLPARSEAGCAPSTKPSGKSCLNQKMFSTNPPPRI